MNPVLAQPDCSAQLALLRQAGAHTFEPARFFFLELLARRLPAQPERVQGLLQARVQQGLAEWNSRREAALRATPQAAASAASATSAACATPLETPPLRALCDYLAQQAHGPVDPADPSANPSAQEPGARTELKSVRQARSTWARLSADRQLSLALDQAPKNAGPINSHMLVLRSLALMRGISPDYLKRFMSYADTLLCLEQGEKTPQAAVKNDADGAGAKAKKARSPRKHG